MENLTTKTTEQAELEQLDKKCQAELAAAGIETTTTLLGRREGEVPATVVGTLHGWAFTRSWNYWVAKGPGIPPADAMALYRSHAEVVRVAGDCACRSPIEWFKGFAVDLYHVDTAEGLEALATMISRIANRHTDQPPRPNPTDQHVQRVAKIRKVLTLAHEGLDLVAIKLNAEPTYEEVQAARKWARIFEAARDESRTPAQIAGQLLLQEKSAT